jgi:hypothetical protein
MHPDTLTILRRIAIGPATLAELVTATGIEDAAPRVQTLQTHKLVETERQRGAPSVYSIAFKGRRYLTAQGLPMGEVAGPRIPYSTEPYRPPAWIVPREMARSAP